MSKRREDGNGMRCLACCCCCCCFSPLARSVWASTEPQAVCVPQTEKTSLNLLFLLLLLVKSNGLTFFFSPTPLLHFFIVSVLRSGQPVSIPVGLPFSELVDYQVARPRLGRAAETKVSLSLSLSLSSLSSLNNSEDVARPCGISSSLGKNLNDDDQVQGCLLLGVAFPLHFLIVFICSPSISPRRRSPHEKTDNETLDTYKT